MTQRGGKDKGRGRSQQAGLGRIRRASAKNRKRIAGWERYAEDDAFLEQHATDERTSHTGERLLAKFNRLARDESEGTGIEASVYGFEGAHVLVRTAEEQWSCEIRTVLKKQLRGVRNPIAVGDRVRAEKPEQDSEAGIITALLPRDNQLARADSHNKALVHVLAANIDDLVIVTSMRMPEIRSGLIDRYLLIAHYNNIRPIIVLNKADLADPSEYAALYRGLGYDVFTTCADPDHPNGEIDALRNTLKGKTCVLAGQSGVGKSSLVNILFPSIEARVGQVSEIQQKGRHTTTAARSYRVNGGGQLIDTPGIRECGITGMSQLDVALLYPDIAALHHQCKFPDCSHTHEPECAVKAAVENGTLALSRYESYLSIISEDLAES